MWSVEGAAVQCRWFFVSMESSGSAAAQLLRRQRRSRQNFYLLSKELLLFLFRSLSPSVWLSECFIKFFDSSCSCFLCLLFGYSSSSSLWIVVIVLVALLPHTHTPLATATCDALPNGLQNYRPSPFLRGSLAHFVASSTILSFIIPRHCPFTSLQYICICISSCALLSMGVCVCLLLGWDGNSLLLFADSCLFCDVYSSCVTKQTAAKQF